jgi:glycosyltransferase involved in cell wall biosynthesis
LEAAKYEFKSMRLSESNPHITFVIHDIEGGVASMNHQIIENANFQNFFEVHIILWRANEQKNKPFNDPFLKVDSLTRFSFSRFDNYHLTLRKFSAALNQWPGLIVTNDGFELEALKECGSKSVLYSIIHDFYNFRLAIENLQLIDYFICHTDVYFKSLISDNSLRERTVFLLHGVKIPVSRPREIEPNRKIRIISVSRLIESKGVMLYHDIDNMLLKRNIQTEWVIIGSGELNEKMRVQWSKKKNIEFFTPDTRQEVYELLQSGDIFISPSVFEGYGIALLESMSCGLVPVIYQLPIGVYSNLPGDVGFSINPGDKESIVEAITTLDRDRPLLNTMGNNAIRLVSEHYNIDSTAKKYLNFFKENKVYKTEKKKGNKNYSKSFFLDSRYMPNFITRFIKKWKMGV